MISQENRRWLLQLARHAIAGTGLAPNALRHSSPEAAAFVTLRMNGNLRGCIGHLAADQPLSVVVPRCAIAAASEDPRFPAVTRDEVDRLDIEISVLGPLEAIGGPAEIQIGRHGLVVEEGRFRGLLLPQVATEWNWNAEMFLAQTCRKAGLPIDAWKRGAKLFRFEAEVFGETDAA